VLALILAAIVGGAAGPTPTDASSASPCDASGFPVASERACRASCEWWSKHERRCRDTDVEKLGEWDPRPAPAEWSR
jgi:hypothetical protein